MMLSSSRNCPKKSAAAVVGIDCRQRISSAGTKSTVQSIGQFIQKQMDNNCTTNGGTLAADENRRFGFNKSEGNKIGGGGTPHQRKWADDDGHGGTVQLIDPNNNAGEQRKFCCWKDTKCNGGIGERQQEAASVAGAEQNQQQQFKCCAVCGGRIWQSVGRDKRSSILGNCDQQQLLKLKDGEELLVHSACFRCSTCGLDLLGEKEQHVVKHADRFYCSLHGQQQKLKQHQQQNQRQNGQIHENGICGRAQKVPSMLADYNHENDICARAQKVPILADYKLSNYTVHDETSWKKRTTTKTMTPPMSADEQHNHGRSSNSYCDRNNNGNCHNNNDKHSDHEENDDDDDGHLLQKWWERKTEEFNGSKGSSIFRYYNSTNNGQRRATMKVPPPVPPKQSTIPIVGTGKEANIRRKDGAEKNVQKNTVGVGHRPMDIMPNGKNVNNKNCGISSASARGGGNVDKEWRQSPSMGEDRCEQCGVELSGSFVLAKGRCWCPEHFVCANSACARRLLESGFVEEPQGRKNYCPVCYECLMAPVCRKCFLPLTETCLNALGEKWHNECFTCSHCRKPFGTLSFFVEDGKPYCEDDWNLLFTTKCSDCLQPIKVGQKWLEALGDRQFHADCFKCAACGIGLEGKTYFERDQQPFCRVHATAASVI